MFLLLVQHGIKIGDYMLAGKHHGKIKAMHDERGNIVLLQVLLPSISFRS
jgi:translation initiation factor IF-2